MNMATATKRKPVTHEHDLYTLVGITRGLPDRIGPLMALVKPVETLLLMIEEDHRNIKGVAAVVADSLRQAKEAIGNTGSGI